MGDDSWVDMPNFISHHVIESLINNLADVIKFQSKPFALVLHGGEPLLIGYRRLEFLFQRLRSILPLSHVIAIQSNGMLITDKILDMCDQYQVSISVSLDGPEKTNDKFRIGHNGESTYQKVLSGINKLRNHQNSDFLFAGLLAVIDPTTDPSNIYYYFKSLGAESVDFLYRDGNHDQLPFGKRSFESNEYGEWLAGLSNVYLADSTPIRIRIIDDFIRLFLGGKGIKEGIGVTDFGIVVVDTDGTITKNDTLKSNFNGADRFLENLNVGTHRLVDVFRTNEFEDAHKLQKTTSEDCLNCDYVKICGGGMPLHRWSKSNGYNNPSVYCIDQQHIIKHLKNKLQNVVVS